MVLKKVVVSPESLINMAVCGGGGAGGATNDTVLGAFGGGGACGAGGGGGGGISMAGGFGAVTEIVNALRSRRISRLIFSPSFLLRIFFKTSRELSTVLPSIFVITSPGCKLAKLLLICKKHNSEAAVLGKFTDTKRLVVQYNKETVCDLDMQFLHKGLPQRRMIASKPRHSGERSDSRIGSWTSQDDDGQEE